MARKLIDIGVIGNDGTGDSIRDSFRKVNDNFRELYSSLGLGDKLSFLGLSDSPGQGEGSYEGQEGAILAVNETESGIKFKQLKQGTGIRLDTTTNANEITINTVFASISGDPSPQLGGPLSAFSGGQRFPVGNLPDLNVSDEYEQSLSSLTSVHGLGAADGDRLAVNKGYADGKVALAGVDAVDPATGEANPAFGTMVGPLILSRDPVDSDDEIHDGLIAATKRYVDNSAFGSSTNLYVSLSGKDERSGISSALQGRALAYAFRTIEAALKRAEELVNEARIELGPYKKTLTYGGYSSGTVTIPQGAPATFYATNHGLTVDAIVSFTTTGDLPSELTEGVSYYVIPEGLTTDAFRVSERKGGDSVNVISENQNGVHTYRGFNISKYTCTLSSIGSAPSGAGFEGKVYMSVDTISISNPAGGGRGTTYRVGDILELAGIYEGSPATIEVLSTVGNPGAISTFRLVSQGVYSELPGSLAIPTSSNSEFGSGAKFDVTYKVNNIEVVNQGSGYGLVSVRIIPDPSDTTGSGAFGTADVITTNISSITVTDPGTRFTALPSVVVNLPRFKIFTNGKRTDYTGNVTSSDRVAARTRDIREGLYLRGETSGALAQILSHSGELDGVDEIFDVDIKYGAFVEGEEISYGDITKSIQISVLIESGVYEENYPLKVPQNVAIIGDEFRRVQIRPKQGGSSSPWAFINFRRDLDVDGITIASNNFGYHYLTNPENPVFPKINNKGSYNSAASLISLNKSFLQNEVIAWINNQIFESTAPFAGFGYNTDLCFRDVGLIVDAMIFDLKYGEYNRTVSSALKYKSNASGLVAITDQLSQTSAALTHLNELIQDVIDNNPITVTYNTIKTQVVDLAFISETGVGEVINDLFDAIDQIISDSDSVNYPLDNDRMDVFLCNDANIIRAVTCHGHGGFMMVLDPAGQVLAKSPYAQECASFSKSIGSKIFAGGMFVDGFTGNLKFQILEKDSDTFLRVGGLQRMPNLPASFIVNDIVYRINYVRDFLYDPAGSTASFILDETTPWPFELFTYNENACNRDVGLIIDGLGNDIVLGTNFNTRKAGLTYRERNAAEVINNQLRITLNSINLAHSISSELLANNDLVQAIIEYERIVITNILENGPTFAASLTFTDPPGVSTNIVNAKNLLLDNIEYIKAEVSGWIAAQVAGNTAPFTSSFTYETSKCERDVQYIVEALIYDILYGGNSMTRDAGLKYYDGVFNTETAQLPAGEKTQTVAAINYLSYLAQQVIQDLAPTHTYSSETRTSGTPASSAEVTRTQTLISGITSTITSGPGSAPALTALDSHSYDADLVAARTTLQTSKSNIQALVIDYVNSNANSYEVLMPGNRSMLANDFTQVNDMGYGIVVTNGGLLEAVSVFTYYCQISYYAINGGQIRSVSGSSAHGNFALVAEGSDPLEVPTPVTLYYELGQGAECYAPSALYETSVGGLVVYITNYEYVPLGLSELEVIHSNGRVYRYTINSVDTSGLPDNVAKLNISSTGNTATAGLEMVIADGTKLTIRQNSQVVLTGDVVDVATRPSTALRLNETSSTVYRVLQFESFDDPEGEKIVTVTTGTEGIINCVAHGQLSTYQVMFASTGTLPEGIEDTVKYYILASDFTENSFKISTSKDGVPLEITTAGTGTITLIPAGLARTTLRENYNYVDLTVFEPNIPVDAPKTFTVNIASPATFTSAGHGLAVGDVIAFTTTGDYPTGISSGEHFFVVKSGIADGLGVNEFQVAVEPGGDPLDTEDTQSGTHSWFKVRGRAGDDFLAVVPAGPNDESRMIGTKFVWVGETYTITGYDNPLITGMSYGTIYLDKPLVDSAVNFVSAPSFKAAVQTRTLGSAGTLTIRIALTRVTSHDLLEIGTGSYADTNYPNEIYGPPVNALSDSNESQERGSGRVFYVTTDQWGNFNVGPYFRVDQGTGRVTFSAAIALSNLDGIGFKRGVPVSEFSVDSSMGDNATDTVPTENAVRTYIERRLGVSHTGVPVPTDQRIPALTGGFLPIDGSLSMISNLDVNNNKIINLDDPSSPTDAVNLRSLVLANFQDFTGSDIKGNDLIVFTGAGKSTMNATVQGDISLNIDSTAHTLDAQINPGVITNSDINSSAAITQSKLSLSLATALASAPTGTAAQKQASSGVSSFDSVQFTVTDGWVTIKDGALTLSKIQSLSSRTVVGFSGIGTGTPTAVPFSTVVDTGGSVKKTQYGTSTGYLKKFTTGPSSGSLDTDYQVVDDSSLNSVNTLVRRDSSGAFAAGEITATNISLQLETEGADTLTLSRVSSVTGGTTRLSAFNGNGGIFLGTGTLTGDNITTYANNRHDFRTQDRNNLAPIVASTVYATALSSGDPTTGGDTVQGTITGQWILASAPGGGSKGNSRLQATYAADLAEFYEGDKEYETGTVLVFGGEKEVTTSNIKADPRVAGVVSDNAAYSMYGACPGFKNQLALQGRVPCKVVGKIKKGDLLTTSGIPGVAGLARDPKPGTLIGKALQDYDSDHIGTIEVAVGRV